MKESILLFIDSLGSGGAQRQLVGLSVMLKEKGYPVQVVAYQDIPFYADYLKANNISYYVVPGAAKKFGRISKVARYFRSQKPEIVITYLESPSVIGCVVKMLGARFKLIVSERNTTQKVTLREKVRFFLFRYADWIVPNSYSQERFLTEFRPGLSSKIITIPNFVDLEHFVPGDRSERKIKRFINCSSIAESKNTLSLIEAVNIVKRQAPSSNFVVDWFGLVGEETAYQSQCRRKIEEYGLQDIIRLRHKTHDVVSELQDSDVFVFPSFFEGTPNALCEAISCGLPIIASKVSDNPRFVKDGQNGFLFDPREINDIVEAFKKILSSSYSQLSVMGAKSREIALSCLDKSIFIDSYLRLIH